MTLESIREALLSHWPRPPGLAPREYVALDEQLLELTGAHAARLWKSTTLLAGQIIEALLTKRLQLLDPAPSLERVTGLGGLISLAYARGIIPPPVDRRASNASLVAARLLRNWSAHYSLSSHGTNELRATQAIAIAFCASISLFPLTRSKPPAERRGYTTLLNKFEKIPADEQLPYEIESVYPELFAFAATRSLSRLVREVSLAKQRGLDMRPFAEGIMEHFHSVISHVATTNASTLHHLTAICLGFGLKDHARVIAALLPLDGEVLCEMVQRRSPAAVALYLAHSFRADKQLFRAKFARQPLDDKMVDAFWQALVEKNARLVNTRQILCHLPNRARVSIMRRAPADVLAAWVREAPAHVAVRITSLFRDRDVLHAPSIQFARELVIAELTSRVRGADLHTLAATPNFLRMAQVANETCGVAVTEAMLNKLDIELPSIASDGEKLKVARRILWDSYAFCVPLRTRAELLVLRFIDVLTPSWEAICLRGVLACSRIAVKSSPDALHWRDALRPPAHADRWQIYLAIVGAVHTTGYSFDALPRELTNAIVTDPIANDADEQSRNLYNRVMDLLGTTA